MEAYCKRCHMQNEAGRETCAYCGSPLLDIHGIMATDRWVGRAVKAGGIGALMGGILGVLGGAVLGFILAGGRLDSALVGAWSGAWIGIPAGLVIGGCVGIFQHFSGN